MDYFNGKLIEFADALELNQFSLIGNSLGGALSLGLSLNKPEKIKES